MKANKTRATKRPSIIVMPKRKAPTKKTKRAVSKVMPPQRGSESRTILTNNAGKNFLQSSLGAISRSRDDATGAVAEGLGRFAESIGLRKLEDVFDQRVAGALERMGIPTARELTRLKEKVDLLSRQVEALKLIKRK